MRAIQKRVIEQNEREKAINELQVLYSAPASRTFLRFFRRPAKYKLCGRSGIGAERPILIPMKNNTVRAVD